MTKGRRRPHPNVRQNPLEKGLIVVEPLLDCVELGRGELAGEPLADQEQVGIEAVARRVVVLGKVFHMILEGGASSGRHNTRSSGYRQRNRWLRGTLAHCRAVRSDCQRRR